MRIVGLLPQLTVELSARILTNHRSVSGIGRWVVRVGIGWIYQKHPVEMLDIPLL